MNSGINIQAKQELVRAVAGKYRCADMVVLAPDSERGRRWADRALERIRAEADAIGVSLNTDKTGTVRLADAREKFVFLGFEFRGKRSAGIPHAPFDAGGLETESRLGLHGHERGNPGDQRRSLLPPNVN